MRNAIIASTAFLAGAANAAWAGGMDSLTAHTGTDTFQLAQTEIYDSSLYGVSNNVSDDSAASANEQSANMDESAGSDDTTNVDETTRSGEAPANDVDEPASTDPALMDEDPVLPASPEDEPNANETASSDDEGTQSEGFFSNLYESLFGSGESESATR